MQTFQENSQGVDIIQFFLSHGYLVTPDFIPGFDEADKEEFLAYLQSSSSFLVDQESYRNFLLHSRQKPLPSQPIFPSTDNKFFVLQNYKENTKKREVQDFVHYLRIRYDVLKGLLMNRPELKDVVSINRILHRGEKNSVALIGMVKDKRETKNGNILLTLEDLSGDIKIVVSKSNKEAFDTACDIVHDEIIGVTGFNGDKIVFAHSLLFPDIPLSNETKRLPEEQYVIFTSDLHTGSKEFFKNNFMKFVSWLNGEYGNDQQKSIAQKIKHVFILGDLVEGVGIYPGQEKDLVIQDIYEQYRLVEDMLQQVRKDIQLIIVGGNHDALRLSEPQPVLEKQFAPRLFEMSNVTFLTNPSWVNLFSSENFPGFTILLYHGGSFPYLAEHVDSIRKAGRIDRADLIMKFLLQRRHLAPSHGSTLYIPDPEKDHLLIDKIPDFFVTGHIHKTQVLNYRGVTAIGCGCWTGQTENQAKRGIVPDPNRVTLVNLQTREVKILNFGDEDESS